MNPGHTFRHTNGSFSMFFPWHTQETGKSVMRRICYNSWEAESSLLFSVMRRQWRSLKAACVTVLALCQVFSPSLSLSPSQTTLLKSVNLSSQTLKLVQTADGLRLRCKQRAPLYIWRRNNTSLCGCVCVWQTYFSIKEMNNIVKKQERSFYTSWAQDKKLLGHSVSS